MKTVWKLVAVLFVLSMGLPALAQGGPQIQELTGRIDSSSRVVFYTLPALQAGHTLYAYVEATSGNLDTYLALGDTPFRTILIADDDGGGGLNSAFSYTIPRDGDYSLAVTHYSDASSGDYRLVIGLDAPDIFSGKVQPTGHQIAVFDYIDPDDALGLAPGSLRITDCSLLSPRPVLSGPEQTLESKYFLLHYTTSGVDATTPALVQEVAAVLDSVWETEVIAFGWPAPPADCGEGGDLRYDIYLMEVLDSESTLGYTMPEELRGDNPNSADLEEEWAAYSYAVLDNDFSGLDDPHALMRATLAHEFHHAIQFGYDLNDIGGEWYYEATASWMETQAAPEDEDATPYVSDLFLYPDLCIGSTPDDPQGSNRIYAEWLLIDSLAQDYGQEVVQHLWENIATHEGMDGLYQLLTDLGTTPQEMMTHFAIRNLLRHYDMAGRFPSTVYVEGEVYGPGQVTPRRSGVEQLGVDYVRIASMGVYTFSINQPTLTLTVVGIDRETQRASVFALGQRGTVDTRPFDYAYVIILNTRTHTDVDNCSMTDWVLTVSDGAATPLTPSEPKTWSSAHFVPAE